LPSSRTLTTAIVVLIAAVLVSSTFAGYYLLQYQQAQGNSNLYLSELKQASSSKPITTDILLDYGNGTRIWYNGTVVQPGWNLYLATTVVTKGDMNTTWYPSYGEHLVTGIGRVLNNANESWFIWSYNLTSHWQVADNGADQLPTYTGSVYAWSYCGVTPSYAPTCSQP
jgi:hypothetical protein